MIIAALDESSHNETRVAITPHTVKNYINLGFEVYCEKNAGLAAGFFEEDYQKAGAVIVKRKHLLAAATVLACVKEPGTSGIRGLPSQALIIAPIDTDSPLLGWCCKNKISLFSMNSIPRISRAQSMDSLSSQANLSGYRAVLEGVTHFRRAIPMMMTAAGMIQPAKILVLGAGVAGLQAIATAKRLGAVVYAFDVRRAAKEQVESLGAEFVEVSIAQDNETDDGYAKETSEAYKKLQAEVIHRYALQADIIITTALIPGKKAPILLTKDTVCQMKPGSVIVDIATARGGNCELSQQDKIVFEKSITIIGYSNLAGLVPTTASELYANNIYQVIDLLVSSTGDFSFSKDDEIIKQAMLCYDGSITPFQTAKEAT